MERVPGILALLVSCLSPNDAMALSQARISKASTGPRHAPRAIRSPAKPSFDTLSVQEVAGDTSVGRGVRGVPGLALDAPQSRPDASKAAEPFCAGREASKRVQAVILAARSPGEALASLLRDPHSCNHVNVSTALMCAARLASSRAPPTPAEAATLEQVLSVAASLASHGRFGVRHAANIAWAVARLSARGRLHLAPKKEGVLQETVAAAAPPEQLCSSNQPQRDGRSFLVGEDAKTGEELTEAGFSRAVERLLPALAHTCAVQAAESKPAEAAMAVWAFASIGRAEEPLLAAVAAVVEQRAGCFPPRELAMVAWSFATADFYHKGMMNAIADVMAGPTSAVLPGSTTSADAKAVAQTATSATTGAANAAAQTATTATPAAAVVAAAASSTAAAAAAADQLKPQDLSTLTWSFSALCVRHWRAQASAERVMAAAATAAMQQLQGFNCQDIAQLGLAMARLGWDDQALLAGIAERAAAMAPTMRLRELSNLSWAFARLNFAHDKFLRAAVPRALDLIAATSVLPATLRRRRAGDVRPAGGANSCDDSAAASSYLVGGSGGGGSSSGSSGSGSGSSGGATANRLGGGLNFFNGNFNGVGSSSGGGSSSSDKSRGATTKHSGEGFNFVSGNGDHNGGGRRTQELANMAWAVAVLRHDAPELLKAVFEAAEAAGDCADEELRQLYQVWVVSRREMPNVFSGVSKLFLHQMSECWRKEKCRRKESSARHLSVSRVLRLMHIDHAVESEHDIDIAIVGVGLTDPDGPLAAANAANANAAANAAAAVSNAPPSPPLRAKTTAAAAPPPAAAAAGTATNGAIAAGAGSDDNARVGIVLRVKSPNGFGSGGREDGSDHEEIATATAAEGEKEEPSLQQLTRRFADAGWECIATGLAGGAEGGRANDAKGTEADKAAAAETSHAEEETEQPHANANALNGIAASGVHSTCTTGEATANDHNNNLYGAARKKARNNNALKPASSSSSRRGGVNRNAIGSFEFGEAVRVKIALEVDGPAHFTRNTRRMLGHTALKHRMLAEMGWTVVQVPYYDYDPIPFWSSMEKKRYLQRRLGIRRTIYFGSRDYSTFAPLERAKQTRWD